MTGVWNISLFMMAAKHIYALAKVKNTLESISQYVRKNITQDIYGYLEQTITLRK